MHPTDNNIPRNIFQELIAEIVKPDEVEVDSIKQHDDLHPIFWDEDQKLRPEIRKILLKNAKSFIKFANIEEYRFIDIILTGSIANYTYTEASDVDLHIILDFSQISDDIELVNDLFKTKKSLWSKTYATKIKNHEIELYFQNEKEPHHAIGVYSLMKDEWIKKPTKKVLDVNTKNLQEKTVGFINKINDLEGLINSDNFIDEYDKLKEKLKKYRQSGLDKEGEYSTENLVFKLLRNLGYLDKFFNLKNEYVAKNLTINQ
jgi:predicted nucleotidyltransferase